MEGDLIFVNIDPGSSIGLKAFDELNENGRLERTNEQQAWLAAIQSNTVGDENNLKFGGEDETPARHAYAFGRTASAVFRMVMLRAVQISEGHWPLFGNIAMNRNSEALQFHIVFTTHQEGLPFKLVGEENPEENLKIAQRYWAKYDHVFPPFLIKSKVLENQAIAVPFCNKMLIFRDDFQEVIEIITDAEATMYPPDWDDNVRKFDSPVKVTCIRYKIKVDGDGGDGPWFKKLKELGRKDEENKPHDREEKEVLEQLKKDEQFNKDQKKKKDEANLADKMKKLSTSDSAK
jgi:hypothetical protein